MHYININFYVVVPTPLVTVNIIEDQIVGQSLTLTCVVTTVRGVTSRVDILWSIDGLELKETEGVNVSSLTSSSVLYTDLYNITQLSTADEDRTYKCTSVVTTLSPVMATGNVTLNVTGEW